MARKEDLRLTRMMFTIFICFMVSFLPLMIVNVADDDVSSGDEGGGDWGSCGDDIGRCGGDDER